MENQSVSKERKWIAGIAIGAFLLFIIATAFYLLTPPHQKMSDQVELQLPSSRIHEKCLQLSQEQELIYSFEASHPLTFDLHYHDGTRIVGTVTKEAIVAWEATLQPEGAFEYCMTWSNHQPQAVPLTYQFQIKVK